MYKHKYAVTCERMLPTPAIEYLVHRPRLIEQLPFSYLCTEACRRIVNPPKVRAAAVGWRSAKGSMILGLLSHVTPQNTWRLRKQHTQAEESAIGAASILQTETPVRGSTADWLSYLRQPRWTLKQASQSGGDLNIPPYLGAQQTINTSRYRFSPANRAWSMPLFWK